MHLTLRSVRPFAVQSVILFILLAAGAIWETARAADLSSPTNPHYTIVLSQNEFAILNAAEMDGLMKYGGGGDLKLFMAKVGDEVFWTVTIENPRLMELLNIFLGESTIKFLQGLDPENIDPNQKTALAVIRSLTAKLDSAQKNPVWASVKLSGTELRRIWTGFFKPTTRK